MSYFRSNIDGMEGYKPGEQLGEGFIKLNTNENPYPPSPRVIEALKKASGSDLRLYPSPLADALRGKAAEVYGVGEDNVMAGNGSDELLTIAVRAFAGENDLIAYPSPSYVLYPTLAAIQNAKVVEIPFGPDYALPGELSRTGANLTLLSNPNSPTGTFVSVDDVAALASKLNGVLLVDEAYADFAGDSCLRLIDEYDNVIVTRSFSKSFSLAGIRLGLAFACPGLIAGMRKLKDSYNVDRLTIIAGTAALSDMAWMKKNASAVKQERACLAEELVNRGFRVIPSSANFVLAEPSGISARELYEALKKRKILIRYFDIEGLDGFVRISVGTREQTSALLAAIDELV